MALIAFCLVNCLQVQYKPYGNVLSNASSAIYQKKTKLRDLLSIQNGIKMLKA